MSDPVLNAVLTGGPGDGVGFTVAPEVRYLMVTLDKEVHGYEWANQAEKGGERWSFRHKGVTSRTIGKHSAHEVLASHDIKHLPLVALPTGVEQMMNGGAA